MSSLSPAVAPSQDPVLNVAALTFAYPGAPETPVLRGVDLTLAPGERVAIVGESGSGKSTLLHLAAGLERPGEGEVRLAGASLGALDEAGRTRLRRRVAGIVFQSFHLIPTLDARENVMLALELAGLPDDVSGRRARVAERRRRADAALAAVGLEGLGGRLPEALSGGEQQRVAIARALAVEPDLMLLDEPLSALDARLREDLKHELAQLLRETGLTAVYVTHDQAEAFTLGDRVAVMNQGRIEQCDAPEVIYEQPATQFVAGFLGSSNLLPYQRNAEHLVFKDCFRIALPPRDTHATDRR